MARCSVPWYFCAFRANAKFWSLDGFSRESVTEQYHLILSSVKENAPMKISPRQRFCTLVSRPLFPLLSNFRFGYLSFVATQNTQLASCLSYPFSSSCQLSWREPSYRNSVANGTGRKIFKLLRLLSIVDKKRDALRINTATNVVVVLISSRKVPTNFRNIREEAW